MKTGVSRVLSTMAAGAAIFALSLLRCTNLGSIAGSSTEDGNSTRIIGAARYADGKAAARVYVRLRPADFLKVPADTAHVPVSRIKNVMTNDSGSFAIEKVAPGSYCIEISDDSSKSDSKSNAALVRCTATVSDTTYTLPRSTLRPVGSITGTYASIPGTATTVTVQLYGLDRVAGINSVSRQFRFDDVPEGAYTLCAVSGPTVYAPVGTRSITAVSDKSTDVGPVDFVPPAAWKDSMRLTLNTSPGGADVAGTVTGFPVLVRLNASTFDFGTARADGGDLRFTKADGTPLAFEIEQWDKANSSAAIWVLVDTVYGNNDTQAIIMRWGAAAATSASNSAAVFDTAAGLQGVWHLAGLPGDTARDASGNRFNGVPSGMSGTAPVPGAIGACRAFDGVASAIEIPNTSGGKLNFPENGTYTLSAWVYIDTLAESVTQMIVGKGAWQYFLKCLLSSSWEFTEYHTADGWNKTINDPVTAKEWVFLSGVRYGNKQELYVNGTLASSEIVPDSGGSGPRDTTEDVCIGKYLQFCPFYNQGFAFFNGKIDEVRIGNRAPGADWIKLCYMNQKEQDALVRF